MSKEARYEYTTILNTNQKPLDFTHEEQVIMANGFEDVVHKFADENAFTKYKTVSKPARRPDKVVM